MEQLKLMGFSQEVCEVAIASALSTISASFESSNLLASSLEICLTIQATDIGPRSLHYSPQTSPKISRSDKSILKRSESVKAFVSAGSSIKNAHAWMDKVFKGLPRRNSKPHKIPRQGISTTSMTSIEEVGEDKKTVRFSYPDITSEFSELIISEDSSSVIEILEGSAKQTNRESYLSLCQKYACSPLGSLLSQISEQLVLVYSIDLSSKLFDSHNS
jgi:hypothetical protein